jgi:ABC-type branched-subunit amino acid transport system ATPase component/ABC-type branched-subunit amino acid transport system permease subunit
MISPLTREAFQVFLAINIILAMGLYVMVATGQLSLGQGGFMGVGAYASAAASVELGWPLAATIPLAALAAAAIALPVAWGANRVRGVYLIVGTLAVGQVINTGLGNLPRPEDLVGLRGTGGVGGYSVPLGVAPAFILLGCVLVIAGIATVDRSRLGMAGRATRGDADAAQALGIPTRAIRTGAVVLGAAVTGLGGALSAHYQLYIKPDQFDLLQSFLIALYVLIGGTDHWLGPIAGAFALTYLPQASRFLEEYRGLFYGIFLLAVMILSDRGLVTRARVTAVGRRVRRRVGGSRSGAPQPEEGMSGRADLPGARESAPAPLVLRSNAGAATAGTDERSSASPVLRITGLVKRFSGVLALDGVDLDVERGEILGVIGPNGAGKTTLINVVTGLLPPTGGRILLGATDVTDLPAHRRAALGMARTFQAVRLFSDLTVAENVSVAGGLSRADGQGDVVTHRLGLAQWKERMPHELPYGVQRKVQLAQALAVGPQVLFLDEPSIGLNREELEEIGELMASIREGGMSIVLVDHNLDLVMERADRIAVLDFGHKIAEGGREEILANARVQAAYLGAPAGDGA